MRCVLSFVAILFILINNSYAQQKQITPVGQTWVGYLNQTRLSNKWGFWAEAPLI